MEDDKKKISAAQMAAVKRYKEGKYKKFSADIKIEDYNFIDEYCRTHNISKAKLCVSAIKYCINNKIKFDDWQSIKATGHQSGDSPIDKTKYNGRITI